MGETEFLAKLSEILQMEESGITPDTELSEDLLDSIAILSTIAAIDEEFGVTVPTAALRKCRTVSEVLGLAAAEKQQ